LKLVVDPRNEFTEGTETDNTLVRTPARPCPDLAVKNISREYEGIAGETYRVKVTIVNLGNAPSPSTQVWATSLPGDPWPVNGWPALSPTETIRSLAPGETTSFKVGGTVLASNRTAVRIMLDRHSEIAEMDETNNTKDERL
jgi:subtilase family serine protease